MYLFFGRPQSKKSAQEDELIHLTAVDMDAAESKTYDLNWTYKPSRFHTFFYAFVTDDDVLSIYPLKVGEKCVHRFALRSIPLSTRNH